MMIWAAFALLALGVLPVLLILGRRSEARMRREWTQSMDPQAHDHFLAMAGQMTDEWESADIVVERACELQKLGSTQEALRILDSGYEIITAFAPNMIALLAALSAYSRRVTAMAPLPPLQPSKYRAAPVVSLVYINAVLHNFLVSTAERFRFRAYILARCFSTAAKYMWMYVSRVKVRPDLWRDWDRIDVLRRDFGALTADSVEQYRALLSSQFVTHR